MTSHIFKLLWNKRGSNLLLMLEIFLAFAVLFAVYAFVVYHLKNLAHPLGFETRDRWIINLEYLGDRDSAEVAEMLGLLRRELLASEYVEDLAMSDYAHPYSGSLSSTHYDVNGMSIRTLLAKGDENYQRVMGIRLREGRWFDESSPRSAVPEWVVNRKFIQDHFPGRSMIDSILPFGNGIKIIGVMEDYRYRGEFDPPEVISFRYLPPTSSELGGIILQMKPGTPAHAEEAISKLVAAATKMNNFNIRNLDDLRQSHRRSTWIPMIALLCVCGFLCVNVAMGLFGVLWHNIQKRYAEIGLRKAVGASSGAINQQFVLETALLALFAALPGLFFAVQVPLLKIIPLPPAIFYEAIGLSLLTIMALAVLCTLVPAQRAARVHAAEALHEE
jgi:putative ABC transport system permease protein